MIDVLSTWNALTEAAPPNLRRWAEQHADEIERVVERAKQNEKHIAVVRKSRFYGLTTPQIAELIEEGGDFSVKFRGRTFDVYNASGKRKYGEVFMNRDSSWSMRMPSASPATERLAERLEKAGGPVPPPSTKVNLNDVADAIRRGDARRLYSDEDILAAVYFGFASGSDAMNQDF